MQVLHTFFKKEIFSDFVIPARLSNKVAIICSGAPAVPSKKTLMEFLARKGWWAFHIRYRGTWESRGTFLKQSPHLDLLDVIDELPRGFTELWTKERYKIVPKKILLVGSSFGGPAVILALQDQHVTAGVAFSPVVDWSEPSPDEPHDKFVKFMKESYGMVYCGAKWEKLGRGGFYDPISHAREIDGAELMIIHAKDDRIVRLAPVARFARRVGAKLLLLRTGGHLSSSMIMEPRIWKKVDKFMRSVVSS